MSGHWLKLNDTHVRADHVCGQRQDPWMIANALAQLYEVPSIVPQEHPDWDLIEYRD